MYSLILVGVKVQMIFFSSFALINVLIGSKRIFSLYFSGTLNSNSKGIQALFLIASFCFWLTPIYEGGKNNFPLLERVNYGT